MINTRTKENQPQPIHVSKSQVEVALEQPAIFTNKFYFSYVGNTVRIAFCEEIFKEGDALYTEKPRTTVILPFAEFTKFGNEVMRILGLTQESQPQQPTTELAEPQ